MADSRLSDFFAKRDKKKGKTKKYLSPEELVKHLEVNTLKEKELSSKNSKPEKIDEEAEVNVEHDDEWKEFEEEKRPDLTNLKLGQLNIEEDENNRENQAGNDYDENFPNDGDNSEANPWKKANAAAAPAAAPRPEVQQKSTGVFVPSHMREGGAGNRMRNKKNAPDLQNTEFFPSLGTEAKPIVNAWNTTPKGFEEVKHGGKQMSSASGQAPVSTGNAYSSLLSETLDS